ncbi:MAG: hypothetical protein ACFFCZ_18935, partial [Promethearchaeota archaeon]
MPGHDILLIPEQENANKTIMEPIGTAWASTLTDFVTNGGIVILMDCYSLPYSEDGPTSHLYNASGLMQIDGINPAGSVGTANVVNSSDALSRGIASSWGMVSGTISFDISDGTTVVDDGTDPLVVHKIMGQGHVVLLGFDLFNRETNYDTLLANAIRLYRHVVFDESH